MPTIDAQGVTLDAVLMKLFFVRGHYPLAVVMHPKDAPPLQATMPDQRLDLGIYVPGAYVPLILHPSAERQVSYFVWNVEQYEAWAQEVGLEENS